MIVLFRAIDGHLFPNLIWYFPGVLSNLLPDGFAGRPGLGANAFDKPADFALLFRRQLPYFLDDLFDLGGHRQTSRAVAIVTARMKRTQELDTPFAGKRIISSAD